MKTAILFFIAAFTANMHAQAPAFTAHWEGAPDKMKIRANDQMWQGNDAKFAQGSVEDLLWQKEEQYWQYVKNYDLESYRKLWDENFMGYPSNNVVVDKDHITDWLTEMKRTNRGNYDYKLTRKVENVFGDTAIVFYDVTQTWTNAKNKVVKSNALKIIHTWKKTGQDWLIVGGMGAVK